MNVIGTTSHTSVDIYSLLLISDAYKHCKHIKKFILADFAMALISFYRSSSRAAAAVLFSF